MNASDLAQAGVHPAPGDTTITRAFRRFSALRRLMVCDRAIAELVTLARPTLADRLLLEKYQAARRRLVAELGLVMRS